MEILRAKSITSKFAAVDSARFCAQQGEIAQYLAVFVVERHLPTPPFF
jgi:hypothetical protein